MKKFNISDLTRTVSKLAGVINRHVGSNGTAHLAVTENDNGFMTYMDKRKINKFGNEAEPTTITNLLELPVGRWYGRSFSNCPVTTGEELYVEVKKSQSTKMFIVNDTSRGKSYTRYLYGDNLDSGWFDGKWLNIPLAEGLTGFAIIRKMKLPTGVIVDLKFRISSTSNLHEKVILTIPFQYKQTHEIPIYHTIPCKADDNLSWRSCLMSIAGSSGDDVRVYATTTTKVTDVSGNILFLRDIN